VPSVSHPHGHSHDTDISVSRHTSRVVNAILLPCMLLTVVGLILLWPNRPEAPADAGNTSTGERAYGTVATVTTQVCPTGQSVPAGGNQPCGVATVKVTSGPGANRTFEVDLPRGPGAPTISVGDKVVLAYLADAVPGQRQYAIIDEQRGQPMVLMIVLCALVIVAFGRLRGLTALVGLVVSFAALLFFVIPAILDGEPPLLVAIVGSAAIMFAVLYLTHGLNVHTSVAILGTLASLVVTGLLGAAFTAATKLTGFGSDESLYLSILNRDVDMRGLLLAGIIIGALGVLDDVTVTQASTVAELAPTAESRIELYRAATRIGRAHVASAVNTIILAYAGASLPLLLLVTAGGRDVSDLLTSEFLAQEIVRSAVGTIGLVAAVPITTALASLVADLRQAAPVSPAPSGHPVHPGPADPSGYQHSGYAETAGYRHSSDHGHPAGHGQTYQSGYSDPPGYQPPGTAERPLYGQPTAPERPGYPEPRGHQPPAGFVPPPSRPRHQHEDPAWNDPA
jgi:uncharacterized membrane protein